MLIAHCKNLTTVPIDKIGSNEIIYMWGNLLTSVDELGDNNNIKTLDIAHNKIEKLKFVPKNIKELMIQGNPLCDISGLWKSKSIETIYINSDSSIYDEIKTYSNITNVRIVRNNYTLEQIKQWNGLE